MNRSLKTKTLFICTAITLFLIVLYWKEELRSSLTMSKVRLFEKYEPKNVFLDLGANKGDSVVNFLGITEKALGGKISNLIDLNLVRNKSWIVYAVEANPYFNNALSDLKKQLERNKTIELYLYNETAAWTSDGFVEFFVDTVNSGNDFWGSSLNKNHPDAVRSGQKSVKVRSVDVARLIKQYDERDLVVVKMDIEGAEYDLLVDFIQKDAIRLVDYIAIEYHNNIAPFKNPEDLLNVIIKRYGIKFARWN